MLMAKITKKVEELLPRTWSPNQVVAHNLTSARLLRGWTQDQAAAALAPYLGSHLSAASFSAIERSIAGTRVKQFNADELVALSRAFQVPLGWWFTPPPEGALHTPDHQRTGLDFAQLVDIILGTPDTLPPWTEALEQWAAHRANTDRGKGPTVGAPGRAGEQVELRARALIRERFGDINEASDVLRRLADLLDQLDEPDQHGTAPADDVSGT
jgi:transcriptional regulator with XRE-family HTH domain